VAAAEVVGQAAPAQAADGDPVLQGIDNGPATARTLVMTAGFAEFASLADSSTSNGKGSVGVWGHGKNYGVMGEGFNGGHGVLGLGGSSGGAGVVGAAGTGGDGVQGSGDGSGSGVTGRGGNGGGAGVAGNGGGSDGNGVLGIGAASGVIGGGRGNGVYGSTSLAVGAGVLAEHTAGGDALKVSGKASFSRSGTVTVPAGKSSVTKPGVALTAASLVLATLQQHAAGVYVLAAVPNVAGSSFTVYLSKAVPASTKVAWFVIN
jgi:hypothetical protein